MFVSNETDQKMLITKIDSLRRIVEVFKDQPGDKLQKHSVTVADGLLKSVWWMTNEIDKAASNIKRVLLLRIRKTLGSLLSITRKLCMDD